MKYANACSVFTTLNSQNDISLYQKELVCVPVRAVDPARDSGRRGRIDGKISIRMPSTMKDITRRASGIPSLSMRGTSETGSTRPPTVHSPFVPALPPSGGRPPTCAPMIHQQHNREERIRTSTTLNTSTSSCTKPDLARAMVSDRAVS